jgi:hypothetical protein
MENQTTWSDCRLSSPELDRTELMMGKFANRSRVVHFHRNRYSGNCGLSPFGRWRETRTALRRFAPSPQSIQFVPLRVSSDAPQDASLWLRWRSALNFATAVPLARGVRSAPP